jgi:hypothetical protein
MTSKSFEEVLQDLLEGKLVDNLDQISKAYSKRYKMDAFNCVYEFWPANLNNKTSDERYMVDSMRREFGRRQTSVESGINRQRRKTGYNPNRNAIDD